MPGERDARDLLGELRAAVEEVTNTIPFGYYNGKVVTGRWITEADIVEWIVKVYALKEKVRDL